MLVILKIPVVYLCLVVWWAIRAEPRPLEPASRRLGRAGTSARLAVLAGTAAAAGSRTARLALARVPAQGRPGGGAAVSTPEVAANRERVDTVVRADVRGRDLHRFVCATELHLRIAGTHVQMRPVRVGIAAVVLALIAAGIGGRHQKLAAAATAFAGVGWLLGMIIAVVTERPLF